MNKIIVLSSFNEDKKLCPTDDRKCCQRQENHQNTGNKKFTIIFESGIAIVRDLEYNIYKREFNVFRRLLLWNLCPQEMLQTNGGFPKGE